MLTKFTANRGPNRDVGDWKCLPLVPIPTRAPFCVSRPQNVSGNALTEHPFFPRGSVKANIGHIEGGSGLAAIVKAILVLEKGIIPPNALFEKLNPNIDADFYNLQVQLPLFPAHREPLPHMLSDSNPIHSLADGWLAKNFSQLIWCGRS
jgi:hypothetical protein